MPPGGTSAGVRWEEREGELRPIVGHGRDEKVAVWAPQPGAQEAFLSCPVFECLLEGPRGGGKTDVLLMDFLQHVGRGWGADWRGLLFRRSFPELKDIIAKSKKWFKQIFPAASYNEAKSTWTFPDGAQLVLAFIYRPEDYWSWHGQQFTWIAFEELTTWPDDTCYKVMMSCCRSSRKGIPRKYRATTNPYGIGHNWVKLRFGLPVQPGYSAGQLVKTDGEPDRVAVHSTLSENRVLLSADPDYVTRIRAAARNASELAAWIEGSWDITSGGMFDDLWLPPVHVVPDLPAGVIPAAWKIDRSYDHGQSRPFSVGWWAESNGEPIEVAGRVLGSVRGDLFRIFEWYGFSGKPDEGIRLSAADIAEGILDREEEWLIRGRVRRGIADASIFDRYEPNKSVAGDMANVGVRWDPSDKGPGSRRQGWEKIRDYLRGALPPPEGAPREEPGLFVCYRCAQWRRTVPGLPRLEADPDDVDTDAEDHIADETRYRVRKKIRQVKAGAG